MAGILTPTVREFWRAYIEKTRETTSTIDTPYIETSYDPYTNSYTDPLPIPLLPPIQRLLVRLLDYPYIDPYSTLDYPYPYYPPTPTLPSLLPLLLPLLPLLTLPGEGLRPSPPVRFAHGTPSPHYPPNMYLYNLSQFSSHSSRAD